MDNVLQAMADAWEANAALVAVLPRWYTTEAPPNHAFPYAVCFTLIEVPDYTFDTSKPIETLPLQISVFEQSLNPTTIMDIATKCKAVFDYGVLAVAGYTHVRTRRVGDSLMREEDGVNHWWVQYDIITEKD